MTECSTYDEDAAFLCACKGEPYTAEEWEREVVRLRGKLIDAEACLLLARIDGVCLPERFR